MLVFHNKPNKAMRKSLATTKIFILVGTFAILALLIVVGFIMWPREEMAPQNQKPTSATDLTANWKVYQNEKYGFEMRYPSDWIVEKDNSQNEGLSLSFKRKEDIRQHDKMAEAVVIISIEENPQRLSLEEFYDGSPGGDLFVCGKDNTSLLYVAKRKAFNFFPCTSSYEITIIPLRSYFISISILATHGSILETGNIMLSTLKIFRDF